MREQRRKGGREGGRGRRREEGRGDKGRGEGEREGGGGSAHAPFQSEAAAIPWGSMRQPEPYTHFQKLPNHHKTYQPFPQLVSVRVGKTFIQLTK